MSGELTRLRETERWIAWVRLAAVPFAVVVPDAQDADVINHEYGHAIQDSQVPGFGQGQEAGAIGEGFADYFAADQSATWTPSPEFDPCLAEWDAMGYVPPEDCLRRVDLNPTVAQQLQSPCDGEIHCLGEVWSSALWTIRGALGGPAADKLISSRSSA